MIASALRWVSFLWAIAALLVMAFCAYRWFPDAANPKLGELQLAFMIAAFGGVPAWLSLPLLGLAQRKSLSAWQFWSHFPPTLIAVGLYSWGRSLSDTLL